MSRICMIYITFPSKKEAKMVAKFLLEEKLVACCNIFSIESIYWWKGKIENTKEFVLIAKTLRENVEKVEEVVKKKHSYTIPFIGVIDESVNKEYFDWMNEILK